MRRPRVLVLMGGPDAEREVSLHSGEAIARALERHRGHRVDRAIIDDVEAFAAALPTMLADVDAVFPALHGRWGEGGALQRLLEAAGTPFVGSGAEGAAHAMDKARTKRTLVRRGVATPEWLVLGPGDACTLPPPVVVKPIDDGSSVNLRLCRDAAQLDAARRDLHPKLGTLLVERLVRGREVTLGILDGEPLPIVEIVPNVEFYDYDAKYLRNDTRYVVDPDLPPPAIVACRQAAMTAWSALGLRHLARADFIVGDDHAWFLEINTMPGFTDHSLLPMAAAHVGMPMPDLCARLVDAALGRMPAATTARRGR